MAVPLPTSRHVVPQVLEPRGRASWLLASLAMLWVVLVMAATPRGSWPVQNRHLGRVVLRF